MAKIAVVGLGYWGPNLVRNLYSNRKCTGLVLCDKNETRLNIQADRYPGVEKTTSFESVLQDPAVKGVVIATEVMSHYALAKMVLESDRHVFVEKPFAASEADALDLVEIGERRGLVTMVGHTFLFSPPVIKTREIIQSGELGDIFFITTTRVNLGLHQKDVSVVWDLAPHDFSILFYWLGEEPDRIEAFGNDFVLSGIPDVAFINLHFPSNIIANMQLSWLSPSKLRRTVVVGSRKMLVYDDTEPDEKIKIYDKRVDIIEPASFGEYQLTYRSGDIVSPKVETTEPLAAEIDEFLQCISTGATPISSGRNGLAVVKALELADRSLQNSMHR